MEAKDGPIVNTQLMYKNLIEKSRYAHLDKENIHYNGDYQFFAQNQRGHFNILAEALISDGNPDMAGEVIHRSLQLFPIRASVRYHHITDLRTVVVFA